MIVIISKKDFLKNKKKFLKNGKYAICDTTGDRDIAELGSVKNCEETFEDLDPADALVDGSIDSAKYDKKLSAYLKINAHTKAVALACGAMLKHDGKIDPDRSTRKNVYVVFRNNVYKKLGKAIYKKWCKILDLDEDDDDTVIVLFRKALDQLKTEGVNEDDIKKEIKKIDKKIDAINEDLEAGNLYYFDDDDVDKLRKKLKKLRKERANYARMLDEGKLDDATDEMICDAILDQKIGKSTCKKLAKFCLKYHECHSTVSGRTSYYE